jgi:DNA gyrase/topoisomerase IV subunit A
LVEGNEDMAKLNALYDQDFVRWTEEQAAALRQAKSQSLAGTEGSNLPLDWENLAEEIESLGKSDRRELRSQITRVLRHLLKLEATPAAEPRAGWRATINEARTEIEGLLEDSPSLRRETQALIQKQVRAAARQAGDDLGQHGEPIKAIRAQLEGGGYTEEQVLGDWFPDESG